MDIKIEEVFEGYEIQTLTSRVRELEYACAELQIYNNQLQDRCKKLASRQPSWPKGYNPRRHRPAFKKDK